MEIGYFSQEKFKNPIELLKESWQIYFSKIKVLIVIVAIPAGISLLTNILASFLDSFFIWLVWLFLFFLSFLLWLLVIPSLLCALKENFGSKEAYQKGLKIFLPYLWVYFLVTIISLGGFLLLIIPGIIFSIWFSLAVYVLVFEEKKGILTLFKSKQLIAGRWWAVFWRLFILGLILAIFLFSFNLLITNFFGLQISEKFDFLLLLFIFPFGLIYQLLIYQNLKEIKEKIPSQEILSKGQKIKYGLIAILGLIIFIPLLSLTILTNISGRDEPPPEDRDLLLPKVEISREENAFYCFLPYFDSSSKEIILEYWPEAEEKLKESKEIYWPAEKTERIKEIIGGKEWDEELVKDVVEKNKEFFEDFQKFIQSPYFQDPVVRDPASFEIDMPLLSLGQYRTFAKLNLLRSTYLFKQGKEKEAFNETIKVIKMGQMLQNSPLPSLIQYLEGMAIKRMGLENLRAMLKETNFSTDLLKSYTKELDQFYANRESLAKIFKGEYISLMNVKTEQIDPIAKGKKLSEEKEILTRDILPSWLTSLSRVSYLYKPNQTQRIFAEGFRKKIEIADKEFCDEPLTEPLLPYSKSKLLLTENLIGKALHDIVTVSYGGLFQRRCLEDFSVGGTQLLIALKAYQIENGKLPDSLDKLVPEYILELPKDPFNKKIIKYSPEKKVIYSIGPNGRDDGGSEGEKWEKMPDPTFQIEF